MKQRKSRRRTLRSKRSRRSRKASRKRYTRGGNEPERIGFGGINYSLRPNSDAPGPEWSFSFVSPTENVPLHRVGANMDERVVRRRDDRGWDLYTRFLPPDYKFTPDEEPRVST
jgi:hypothetical protein